jgi:CHAT domain-containing protein
LQRGDSKQVLAATLPEFRQVFARHVEEWRGSPLRPGGLSYLQFGERRSILSQLIRLSVAVLGAEQGAREAFVQLMEVQTLGSLARSLELTAPDLQAVQRDWLPADSGILILLPSQDASHLFAVEKTRIGYWELPPWSRLRSALEHLLVTILRPPARQQNGRIAPAAQQKAQQAGRRLAELLLPEEAAAWIQRWRSMTVVGLDLLGWVPMEALVLPDGEPLGLSKAVTYVPSLPVAMMLQRRVRERPRQAPALDVFLVGAPSHDLGKGPHLPQESAIGRPAPAGIEGMNSLPVLPLDQTAAEDLLSGYPPKRTAVFLHDQATPQAVFRELQTGVRIAHFLTHGIYDGDRERPAGLLLSPDSQSFGFFWCEDVECLPPVDLAILSACGAAKGPKRQGDDGVQNLGGAFLRAGAGAVILTRAELDYYATFDLMKVLHQELLSGSGPAKAMLGARQRLAADERYQHPYYHSLLQVMGLGQRPLFAPQRGVNETAHPLWLWITVGALLIVLVAMLRRRARRVTD